MPGHYRLLEVYRLCPEFPGTPAERSWKLVLSSSEQNNGGSARVCTQPALSKCMKGQIKFLDLFLIVQVIYSYI